MCYNISYLTKRQLDYAKRYGDSEDLADIKSRLPAAYAVNGFQFPKIPLITEKNGWQAFEWGLIPEWVKSDKNAYEIRSKTLNARGESIFEKPAFKDAAQNRRCLVVVDGFFENHHEGNRVIPYFICHKEAQPLSLGGLWSEWENEQGVFRHTVSIVTTQANSRMEFIHNNPKVRARGGARMPLILPRENEQAWLDSSLKQDEVRRLILPFSERFLQDYTVRPLSGKSSPGNTPSALEKYIFPDESTQMTLF